MTYAELELRSDADLLERCDRGDESAFLVLYRRHSKTVFRFALHMAGRSEVAEDVTQEVFLLLIREPSRFRDDRGTLEGFLLGVARNKVRNWLRAERPKRELIVAAGLGSEQISAQRDGGTGEFELDLLRDAILALPFRYREVVVLCELEEKSYAEAAQLLGCVVGTIRSRLYRARRLLSMKFKALEGCLL